MFVHETRGEAGRMESNTDVRVALIQWEKKCLTKKNKDQR